MRLSARQIDIFRVAFRLKSTRKAAVALFVSQPAVSRAISELEAQIGVSLFDRSGRKFEPTLAAHSLSEAVHKHYIGLDHVVQAARMIAEGTTGHIRVAALPVIADTLVARAAGKLMKDNPNIRIDLDVMGQSDCLAALRTGDVDCAVLSSDPGDTTLICQQVTSISPVLAIPANDPAAVGDALARQSLNAIALVALPADSPFMRLTKKAFADASLKFSVRAEARTQTALLEFVAQGVGWAFVDPDTAGIADHPGIALFGDPLGMSWPIRTIIPASAGDVPVLQMFQSEIAAHAREPLINPPSRKFAEFSPKKTTGNIEPTRKPGVNQRFSG